MPIPTARRHTALGAVATAILSVAALALLIRIGLQSGRGQQWDNSAMATVVAGRDAQLALLSVLGYVSITAIVAVALGCAGVALLRGQPRIGAAAVTVLLGANLTTQILKEIVLDRPNFGLGTLNSLPSGHTTVVASAVGASFLVVPALVRPLVALAGGFATTLTGRDCSRDSPPQVAGACESTSSNGRNGCRRACRLRRSPRVHGGSGSAPGPWVGRIPPGQPGSRRRDRRDRRLRGDGGSHLAFEVSQP